MHGRGEVVVLREGALFHGCYRVERLIRAGGMGRVFEVTHLATQRRCALKVMLAHAVDDERSRERFAREATVTAGLRSDHLVEVFDAGVDDETGLPFLVMERLVGADLGEIIASRGPLPPHEVVTLLAQAAAALDRTHTAAIVHRDLKPSNLFVTTADDGSPRLKILDFGIAKVISDGTGNDATRVAGTPEYMAPEQVKGRRVTPATDVYALAQVAYTMLVATSYFVRDAGGFYATLLRVSAGIDEPASERARRAGVPLGAAFDSWFEAATARRAVERPQPASRAIALLARALSVPTPDARASIVLPSAGAAAQGDTTLTPTTMPSLDRSAAIRVPRSRERSRLPPRLARVGLLAALLLLPSAPTGTVVARLQHVATMRLVVTAGTVAGPEAVLLAPTLATRAALPSEHRRTSRRASAPLLDPPASPSAETSTSPPVAMDVAPDDDDASSDERIGF